MSTALKFTHSRSTSGDARAYHGADQARRPWPAARLLKKSVGMVATTLLVLGVAAFLALAIGPRVLGYQTLTMLTGSMAPLINPGDVVITQPVPASEITAGDIITYHIPVEDQRVETHRVTEVIANPDGSVAVRTKGDANNGADPWTATISGTTVDRHVTTIPHIGKVIRAVREPLVLNILMYGAPAVLVIGMLASIWGKKPETNESHEAGTPALGTNA
ncbi:UNVERIFIED_ORG: signal peptidase [Arthrobacter sp. UYCu721]